MKLIPNIVIFILSLLCLFSLVIGNENNEYKQEKKQVKNVLLESTVNQPISANSLNLKSIRRQGTTINKNVPKAPKYNMAQASPSSVPTMEPSYGNGPNAFVTQIITRCSYDQFNQNQAGYYNDIKNAIYGSIGYYPINLVVLPPTVNYGPPSNSANITIQYYIYYPYTTYSYLSSRIRTATAPNGYFNYYMNLYALTYGANALYTAKTMYAETTNIAPPSPSSTPAVYPSAQPVPHPTYTPVIQPTAVPTMRNGNNLFVTQIITGCGYDQFLENQLGYVNVMKNAAYYSTGLPAPLDFTVLSRDATTGIPSNDVNLTIQYYMYSSSYSYSSMVTKVESATSPTATYGFTYYMNYYAKVFGANGLISPTKTMPAIIENIAPPSPSSFPIIYPSAAPTAIPTPAVVTVFVTQIIVNCGYDLFLTNQAGYIKDLTYAATYSFGSYITISNMVVLSTDDMSSGYTPSNSANLTIQYDVASNHYTYDQLVSSIARGTAYGGYFTFYMNYYAYNFGAFGLVSPAKTLPATTMNVNGPVPTITPVIYPSASPNHRPSQAPIAFPTPVPSPTLGPNVFVTQVIMGCGYQDFQSNEAGYIQDLTHTIQYSIGYGLPLDLKVLGTDPTNDDPNTPPSNSVNITITYYIYSSYSTYEYMSSWIKAATSTQTYGFNYYMQNYAYQYGAYKLAYPTRTTVAKVANIPPPSPSSFPVTYPSAAPVIFPTYAPNTAYPVNNPTYSPSSVFGSILVTQIITGCGYQEFVKNEAGYISELIQTVFESTGYLPNELTVLPTSMTSTTTTRMTRKKSGTSSSVPPSNSVNMTIQYTLTASMATSAQLTSLVYEFTTNGKFTNSLNSNAIKFGAYSVAAAKVVLYSTSVTDPFDASASPVLYPSAAPYDVPSKSPVIQPTAVPTYTSNGNYLFSTQVIVGCGYDQFLQNQAGYIKDLYYAVYYSTGITPINMIVISPTEAYGPPSNDENITIQYYLSSSSYTYSQLSSKVLTATTSSGLFNYYMNLYASTYFANGLAKPAMSLVATVLNIQPPTSIAPILYPSAAPVNQPTYTPHAIPTSNPSPSQSPNVFVTQVIDGCSYNSFLSNQAGYIADITYAIYYSMIYRYPINLVVLPPDATSGPPSTSKNITIQYYLYSSSYSYASLSSIVSSATSSNGYFTYYMNTYALTYGALGLVKPAKTLPATVVNLAPPSPSSSPIIYPSANPVANPTYTPHSLPTSSPTTDVNVLVTQIIVKCGYDLFLTNQAGYFTDWKMALYYSASLTPINLVVISPNDTTAGVTPSNDTHLTIQYYVHSNQYTLDQLKSKIQSATYSSGYFTYYMNYYSSSYGAYGLASPAKTLVATVDNATSPYLPSSTPVNYPTPYPSASPAHRPTYAPIVKPTPAPSPTQGSNVFVTQVIMGCGYQQFQQNEAGYIQDIKTALVYSIGSYYYIDLEVLPPNGDTASGPPSNSVNLTIQYYLYYSYDTYEYLANKVMVATSSTGYFNYYINYYANYYNAQGFNAPTKTAPATVQNLAPPSPSSSPIRYPSASPISRSPSSLPTKMPMGSPTYAPNIVFSTIYVTQVVIGCGYQQFQQNEAGYISELHEVVYASTGSGPSNFLVVGTTSVISGIPPSNSVNLTIQYSITSSTLSYSELASVVLEMSTNGQYTYNLNKYAIQYGAYGLQSPAKIVNAMISSSSSYTTNPVIYPSAAPYSIPTKFPIPSPVISPKPTLVPSPTQGSNVFVTQVIMGCGYQQFQQNEAGYIQDIKTALVYSIGSYYYIDLEVLPPNGDTASGPPSNSVNLTIQYYLYYSYDTYEYLANKVMVATSSTGYFNYYINYYANYYNAQGFNAPTKTAPATVQNLAPPSPSSSPIRYPSASPISRSPSSLPTRYPTIANTRLPTSPVQTIYPTFAPNTETAVSATLVQYIYGPGYNDYTYNKVGYTQVFTYTIEQCVLSSKPSPYIGVNDLVIEPTDSSFYPSTSSYLGITYTILSSGDFTSSSLANTIITCTSNGDWNDEMQSLAAALNVAALETATTGIAKIVSSSNLPNDDEVNAPLIIDKDSNIVSSSSTSSSETVFDRSMRIIIISVILAVVCFAIAFIFFYSYGRKHKISSSFYILRRQKKPVQSFELNEPLMMSDSSSGTASYGVISARAIQEDDVNNPLRNYSDYNGGVSSSIQRY